MCGLVACMQPLRTLQHKHTKCKALIQEILAKEVVCASKNSNTEEALKDKHLNHEKTQKLVKKNRFNELIDKTEKEASDRRAA